MIPNTKIDQFVIDIFSKDTSKGAHAYDHTKRVYKLAMHIGEIVGANPRILGAASLLHDIGRNQEVVTGKSHSILSGEMGMKKLQEVGYSADEIEQVVSSIRTHRYSEDIEPVSLEGEVLSDADKLDAMGAIGVFRGIAHASITGSGIEGFLAHADEKLLKLRDLMHTKEGARLAKIRHSNLESFIDQLAKEMQGEGFTDS
ncbi:MAG: HD domain-containing protein [Candidatus Thorarchaeota archaeon]